MGKIWGQLRRCSFTTSRLPSQLLCFIVSMFTFFFVCWCGSLNVQNGKYFACFCEVVWHICVHHLKEPPQAWSILGDSSHPLLGQFQLLLSRCRFNLKRCRTNRLKENNYLFNNLASTSKFYPFCLLTNYFFLFHLLLLYDDLLLGNNKDNFENRTSSISIDLVYFPWLVDT